MTTSPQEKKGAASPATEAKTPRRGRSAAYPAVALDKAIEMARKVWNSQRKQEAHIDATLHALGYASKNGASLRALAALKQYGLLVDSGEGDTRKMKLSEAAQDILLLPDTDERKATALRVAALCPTIHAILWERYGTILPNDEAIIPLLVRDNNYHEDAAHGIISNYRSTFELAKLDKNIDSKPDETPKGFSQEQKPKGPLGADGDIGSNFIPMTSDSTVQEMPFLVGPGKVARVPFPMAEDDFELFIGMLNLAKKKLTAPHQSKGRPAIWQNNNHDQPVVVTGEMVTAEGAKYYKIEGSQTGVPESQIVFR